MNKTKEPSLAASLIALAMALITAWLVLWADWTPLEAIAAIIGGAISISLGALAILFLVVRPADERAAVWKVIRETATSDLQPAREIWRILRGRK
ncbi:MAG: hypothetical protein NT159_19295 [Proteobacteria bacterium]|nr:hypothetical protein [Pseudomonadota bacterium]